MKGLIIGASSGIGEAIANHIKETGIPRCDEWLMPPPSRLDVRFPNECYHFILDNGPFYYIVYSAGVNQLAWMRQIGKPYNTLFSNAWETNCGGFVTIMAAHEFCFGEAPGSAIAISSDAARRPMRGSVAYCSSKAALDMAVRTMARELAPRWRVNAVSPGITGDTGMTEYLDEYIPDFRGWTPEFAKQYELGQIPMGRRADKAEIAELAAQVLEGPEYMTGAIIEINGGR